MLPLAAYADRMSVRPGETIAFKVSSMDDAPYTARLVRVISADPNPAGPGILEEPVEADFARSYRGRFQPVHAGSYGIVEQGIDLGAAGSLSLIATIWPTRPGSGRRQGVLSVYDPAVRRGIALAIGEDGSVEAMLGATRVKTRAPLEERHWYRVFAVYDAATATLTAGQVRLEGGRPIGQPRAASVKLEAGSVAPPAAGMPWIIGALGGSPVKGHFNGKIERPMIAACAADPAMVEGLTASPTAHGVIARWDFSRDISTIGIVDAGPGGHHGRLVNLPARAMTGAAWTGREMCFRHAPEQYGAIHFHEDDVSDCGWETDFTWTVPAGTRSGTYAVRLSSALGEENVPFFVVPPRGTRTADLAVLVSTYTYTVYSNHARPESADPKWLAAWKALAKDWGGYPYNPGEHRDYGLSTYNFHTDGSGICHASWLRPMLNVRVGYITYPHPSVRASGLRHYPADSHLITWLEKQGIAYDIITDLELDTEGVDLLRPYRVVTTGSHPEYHTGAMLDALEAYRDGGGRFMYLGGNGFYWKVARHKEAPAAIEIRRGEGGIRAWAAEPGEYYNAFDGEYGGLWRRNGRPPQRLVGVGFTAQGNFVGSHYRQSPDGRSSRAAWILEGIGADELIGGFGLSGHGAAGFELDRADKRLGTPSHAVVVASSEGHEPDAPWVLVPEEQLTHITTWAGKPADELIRADLTFFETPNNGAVFSTGSITFCGSLLHNGGDNNVSRLLRNVLDRFLDPEARFPMPDV
ncbi:MAG: N,N-dimethylformamidase beta subunit family domain-containing protein [Hyphomicrobiaceae bacterium]